MPLARILGDAASEGRSRSLYFSTLVETLRQQYPDNPVLHRLSDETRPVVSEPLGDVEVVSRVVPSIRSVTRCLVQCGSSSSPPSVSGR